LLSDRLVTTVKIIGFRIDQGKGCSRSRPLHRTTTTSCEPPSTPRLEYFLGESGSSHSDIFSLGVITYQMFTGRLPYDAQIAKARTRSEWKALCLILMLVILLLLFLQFGGRH
jgi:serine/threonine protein kinase